MPGGGVGGNRILRRDICAVGVRAGGRRFVSPRGVEQSEFSPTSVRSSSTWARVQACRTGCPC